MLSVQQRNANLNKNKQIQLNHKYIARSSRYNILSLPGSPNYVLMSFFPTIDNQYFLLQFRKKVGLIYKIVKNKENEIFIGFTSKHVRHQTIN